MEKTVGTVEHAYVQTHSRGKFLGMARRSPVMANGQLPGIPRDYSVKYAKTLEFIVNRFGSAL